MCENGGFLLSESQISSSKLLQYKCYTHFNEQKFSYQDKVY